MQCALGRGERTCLPIGGERLVVFLRRFRQFGRVHLIVPSTIGPFHGYVRGPCGYEVGSRPAIVNRVDHQFKSVRYSITFLILGACWIALAIAYRGAAWLLVWPGVSYVLASIAYARASPAMFGKRPSGVISLSHLILLLPYIALAWCVWAVIRLFVAEPASQQVARDLWIGRRPTATELSKDVALVVDLTCELWEPAAVRHACPYVCVPTLDGSVPPDPQLRDLVEKLRDFEGIALIHCAQGHGRSAAVAAAVLVSRGVAGDVDEAVQQIERVRPEVRIAANQRRAVLRILKGVANSKSGKATAKPAPDVTQPHR